MSKGILLVISGPSGSGKGTVLGELLKISNNFKLSISATTREPRVGEIEGENYFFKSIDEFQNMIKKNRLIEWVEYCKNYYGTPKEYIENCINDGFDVILEIEVEGALKVKEQYPDCVLIFLIPPSFTELRRRLEKRATEKSEVINNRLNIAIEEMKSSKYYDYIIINNNISKAANDILNLVKSEKLRVNRNNNLLNEFLFM